MLQTKEFSQKIKHLRSLRNLNRKIKVNFGSKKVNYFAAFARFLFSKCNENMVMLCLKEVSVTQDVVSYQKRTKRKIETIKNNEYLRIFYKIFPLSASFLAKILSLTAKIWVEHSYCKYERIKYILGKC